MPPSPPGPPLGPSSPEPSSFGEVLTRFRLARGWSQSRLAAELCAVAGVPTLSRHEISRWERQRRLPGRFWRCWLARVLGLPADLPPPAAGRDRRAGRRGTPTRPPAATRRRGPCAAAPRPAGTRASRPAGTPPAAHPATQASRRAGTGTTSVET
ncbi:helix-turn-helix domain-containing protein [Micromonospora endophytica]|uniref:Helix-turn-helix domain-containing protein n=2 Tax=Micromonospora endophytica TaxID=515350 RepID=A0A2W2BXA9_9ACTN|nr:helix-turn-helix transcriptional regulator [Micromonospora endophytica]PZF91931.1 hypothetical protein C1I93_20465 [Micromonospora endophytica]RIW48534.1 XRE family transcriptional regulator [Micromonospora endophytica]